MNFNLTFKGKKVFGDVYARSQEISSPLICLHGAGNSSRFSFEPLRISLRDKGISSVAFDFLGQGESEGSLSETSLEDRYEQTLSVLNHLNLKGPYSFLATSMSGHVALKLTQKLSVKGLILCVPAVYTQSAWDVPFDDRFSEHIRRPYSWRESDVWQIMENLESRFLLVEAASDEVIPQEVTNKIYDCAKKVKSKNRIVVPNCPHKMFRYVNQDPRQLEHLGNEISSLLQ